MSCLSNVMAQAIKEQNEYAAAFRAGEKRAEPAWLARLRASALARFEQTGFPTTDEEDWKYTNVAPIARGAFTPLDHATDRQVTAAAVSTFIYQESRQSCLVFVNGVYQPELSALDALPAGV